MKPYLKLKMMKWKTLYNPFKGAEKDVAVWLNLGIKMNISK